MTLCSRGERSRGKPRLVVAPRPVSLLPSAEGAGSSLQLSAPHRVCSLLGSVPTRPQRLKVSRRW